MVQSESLLAIRLGLQCGLVRLGQVPKIHQTDNTTAATYTLGRQSQAKTLEERGYNEEYLQLMAYYEIKPRTIHVASPNENGDVESANGALKLAVNQHLLLRGSRDFKSLEGYEMFLYGVMEKRNAGRQVKLAEEIAQMRPLNVEPWLEMRELTVRVGSTGILRVLNNGYTVPSRGIPAASRQRPNFLLKQARGSALPDKPGRRWSKRDRLDMELRRGAPIQRRLVIQEFALHHSQVRAGNTQERVAAAEHLVPQVLQAAGDLRRDFQQICFFVETIKWPYKSLQGRPASHTGATNPAPQPAHHEGPAG